MSWKKIRILVSLVSLLMAGGCMEPPESAKCPSGRICPPGSICAANQDTCISDPCGNGIVDGHAGEMCDDGNIIANDGCSADCTSNEICGNGVLDDQQGELCDDGNQISGDGCSENCESESCGNGVIDEGEVCDDGNKMSGDGCSADCSSETCGDGAVNEPAEECDDGGNSEDCDADCTAVLCGDGFVNPEADEECDDSGDSSTCNANCTPASCGDGIVNPEADEECDDGGESATCNTDCTLVRCGDGIVNPEAGELCDDGGESATCKADCTPVSCGDGIVDSEFDEECDTGGDSAECDSDCTLVDCPDGHRNEVAGEACDDGNSENTDNCTAICELASCTDGFQNADETDVDCGGHCGPSCEPLQHCSTSEDCTGACVMGTCVPHSGDLVTGAIHTCALLDTGAVRCWGYGGQGRLGYGNTNNIGDNETPSTPGNVNVDGTVVQLSAGLAHTCALLDTGTVRCWGAGARGQLGYANTNNIGDNEVPASTNVVDVGGNVIQIATGAEHSCALLDNGAVRCWGYGANGRLGYSNTSNIGDTETPASADDVDVGGNVIQIAAGAEHTCALLDNGAVRCWGAGTLGRLGYGNTNHIGDNETPASAGNVNVGGTVIQLSAGGAHTCALLDNGAVRCWGAGTLGRLGYGNTNHIGDNEHPTSAGNVDIGGTVIQVAAGLQHTCALLDNGAVRCWGYGVHGRLGYANTNNIGDNEAPESAGNVNVGGNVTQLAASATASVAADGTVIGGAHTCVVLDTGHLRCWGNGAYGQLGYGNTSSIGNNEHPAAAGNVSVGGSILPSTASLEHTWELLDTSDAECWSDGVSGQLDRITTSYIAE